MKNGPLNSREAAAHRALTVWWSYSPRGWPLMLASRSRTSRRNRKALEPSEATRRAPGPSGRKARRARPVCRLELRVKRLSRSTFYRGGG